MLKEMSETRSATLLVLRPYMVHDMNRNDWSGMVFLQDDAKTVIQRSLLQLKVDNLRTHEIIVPNSGEQSNCAPRTSNSPSQGGALKPRRGDVSRVLFSGPFLWDAGRPTPHAAYPGMITRWATTLPIFGLAPGGVCRAPTVTRSGGGLLPHRFTLTHSTSCRRSVLCGTFRRLSPPGCYPAPCPTELGLSSNHAPSAGPRPFAPLAAPQYHGLSRARSTLGWALA